VNINTPVSNKSIQPMKALELANEIVYSALN